MIQGHRLRQIREQRALSQGTLGKLVGKDAQYISKLERGVRLSVHTTTSGVWSPLVTLMATIRYRQLRAFTG